jgi:hypothetical protein
MADLFHSTLLEDQLVVLLCGEFGGLSACILRYAMGTTTSRDSRSSNIYHSIQNQVSDRTSDGGKNNHGDEVDFDNRMEPNGKNMPVCGARVVRGPLKSGNSDVFESNIACLIKSTCMKDACEEALIALIDSLVIASELESISSEGECEVDRKDYGGIVLLQRLSRSKAG